jgi:hypothetical protein
VVAAAAAGIDGIPAEVDLVAAAAAAEATHLAFGILELPGAGEEVAADPPSARTPPAEVDSAVAAVAPHRTIHPEQTAE